MLDVFLFDSMDLVNALAPLLPIKQANLYNQGKPFTSFKRVAFEEGALEDLELMSFHSVSKVRVP